MWFGLFDAKGRQIGARVSRRECLFEETAESYGYRREPGHYFSLHVQPLRGTREGGHPESYGAANPMHYFGSAEARDAEMTKAVEAMRTRYARKYGAR